MFSVNILIFEVIYLGQKPGDPGTEATFGGLAEIVKAACEYLLKAGILGIFFAVGVLFPPGDDAHHSTCWPWLMEEVTMLIIT